MKKADRRKRISVINTEMFENDVNVNVGLEIVEKI